MTLDEAARRLAAAGLESPRAEARILLAHALGVTRDETLSLTPPQADAFVDYVARRAAHEPSAYITGHKEFWSLDFTVGPGVLVPRADSETLIEEALRRLPDRNANLRIADLGAGSGALLLAALSEYPHAQGIGFESAPAAFSWASSNAARLCPGRADIRFEPWDKATGPFDLVFSNPPYIPAVEIGALEPEVALHEPRTALDGGKDGLDAYRDLSGLLPHILAPGGFAILEIGAGQVVDGLFTVKGLKYLGTAPDLAGIPRALVLEKA